MKKKKHRFKSEDESATEIVETRVGCGWLLGWPDVSEALNFEKQFQVLIESAMEILIRLRVLSCYMKMTSPNVSRLPATELFN